MKLNFILLILVFVLIQCGGDNEANTLSPPEDKINDSTYNDTVSSSATSSISSSSSSSSVKSFIPQYGINYLDSIDTTKWDLESISFGSIDWIRPHYRVIELRDDNDNSLLPDTYRTWWYTPILIDTTAIESLFITNRGWDTYYVPVYSYDQKNWIHFNESEVKKIEPYTLLITKKFKSKLVWVARFYPYTTKNLKSFIDSIKNYPNVSIFSIGKTVLGNDIYNIEITDKQIPDSLKQVIWLHARTHPAENGSAFVIEGFIYELLSKSDLSLLKRYIFNIVPIHNVDGVILGNYRTNAKSENLEVGWYFDKNNPLLLLDTSPVEVKVLHSRILELLSNKATFEIALNLHSSNSDPDRMAFFFPHFGLDTAKYGVQGVSLFNKQIKLIRLVQKYYPNIEEPQEGGDSFVSKTYPESWWWVNFKDSVNAITLETTYSKAGFDHWVTDDDQRELGRALLNAVLEYLNEIHLIAKR